MLSRLKKTGYSGFTLAEFVVTIAIMGTVMTYVLPTYADITLMVLSSHNNTTQKIRYNDCLPTSLGGIQFTTTTGDVTYLTFTANFRFSTFEIIKQT